MESFHKLWRLLYSKLRQATVHASFSFRNLLVNKQNKILKMPPPKFGQFEFSLIPDRSLYRDTQCLKTRF